MARSKKRPMRRGAQPAKAKVKAKRPASGVGNLKTRLAESLEQQAATAEILRVIGSSPNNTQPVFEVIARSGVTVCGAKSCTLFVVDGDMLRVAATNGVPPERVEKFRTQYPMPLSSDNHVTQVLHQRRIFHLADIEHNPATTPEHIENARLGAYRTRLMVPMLRGDRALGLLAVTTQSPAPFSDQQVALLQTFAAQAVIAIENVRLFKELETRNCEVTEALDQKTATSEILRVISGSPTDAQPVFDMIAESAARLCEAQYCFVYRFEGQLLHFVAHHGLTAEVLEINRRAYPAPPSRKSVASRAVLERSVVQIPDVEADPDYALGGMAAAGGYRSAAAVPILRDGLAIGSIAVTRDQAGLLPERQIELLKTFADQAVIAIENVRLFTELEGRNRDLTATSEILRVISSSPTDVQPVFDTIVKSAVRLCDGLFSALFRFDGDLLHLVAHHNFSSEGLEEVLRLYPTRPARNHGSGRAILERAVVHLPDVEADPEYQHKALSRAVGWRSGLFVPMLREGAPIGVILVSRAEAGPFSANEIALLKTFADQAVIAIENVRLFTELEARNREVTEALDQKTATSEILGVISSSPTDIQPVFDAIMRSAVRLSGARFGAIYRFDGEMVHFAGQHGSDNAALEIYRRIFPMRPERGVLGARAILDRAVVHVPDVFQDLEYRAKDVARASGWTSAVAVPMLREGTPVGAITISKAEPGPFSDGQIALLQTFADQAVIAIENVRLFTELREKNEALTLAHAQVSETLEQQTATAEILRVISSSPTDVQPVFDVIVERAVRLCGAEFGRVYRFNNGVIHMVAGYGISPVGLGELQRIFPRPASDDTIVGRVILSREPMFVRDIECDEGVPALSRRMIQVLGTRSQITIPMLRAGEPIGAMTLGWAEPEAFDEQQIALVKTFADQAVIAIENVRLFTELGARNRDLTEALEQQTATSEILRVISSSPTDVQPVFDTIVRSAVRLCDGLFSALLQFDGELLHHVAQHNVTPEGLEELHRVYPARPTRALGSGRAILERALVHIPDTELDPEFRHLALSRAVGFRSGLFVPMMREGAPIGVITVNRAEPGPFSDSEIGLLRTFADQAVIAVENVRLFTELQASNRELTSALDTQTATSDILRVISRSPTDVQPVFDAIVASAVRLLGGYAGMLTRIAGDQIEVAALTSTENPAGDTAVTATFPQSLGGESLPAQVIRDRAPVNIANAQTDPRVSEVARVFALARGYRSLVMVPLHHHDEAVGTIGVSRRETGGFMDDEIALLQTFADQAVIAIENVRLFNELEGRNRDLTATSEILRVISSSPTDVQPVFDTIVRSAVRLCDGLFSAVYQFDGERLHLVAQHNYIPEALEAAHRVFPARPTRALFTGRTILERAVVHIPDNEVDPEFQHQALSRAIGWRSGLFVPMLREGAPIGVIEVARSEAGPFSDNEVELLKTFADQAVIAVENVRLFKELQARTGELTRSVDQLTALGEISQAVSSTLDVETVLQTIVTRASQLAGADGCAIYEYDHATEAFQIRATHNLDAGLVATLRASPLRKGEGAMGRAVVTREPIQVADIAVAGAYQSHIRDTLLAAGYRALLSVPLLREGEIIGSLSLNRHAPGEFPPEAVEVLKTFATQSALAIQNARLFREIADKSRQLEVASQHKSEFLANMSHELRTPLNAIIGFSEVLNERMFGELNDKQAEYLKDIHASGTHLLSLINDILDLSKVEAGRMELELSDFNLPAAIDSSLTLVRERATRRGITLGSSVHDGIGQMTGDERKIRQVLLNLLSNAIKFTPEGGRIDVAAVPNGGSVEVSVRDTGVGIAPEDHEAVFEEFRQVGASAAKQEGTGLGLALARKFIELHGGKIWVKSQVGVGSTFTFILPFQRSAGA